MLLNKQPLRLTLSFDFNVGIFECKKIFLNWTIVKEALVYKVTRSSGINGPFEVLEITKNTSAVDKGLSLMPQDHFYYQIVAITASGDIKSDIEVTEYENTEQVYEDVRPEQKRGFIDSISGV